jgi:hypothetical protein
LNSEANLFQRIVVKYSTAHGSRANGYHRRCYLVTTPNQARPPRAPMTMVTGGGEPYHSVAVNAPTAMTPHHGSAVSGPLMVGDGVAPDAGVCIYPT